MNNFRGKAKDFFPFFRLLLKKYLPVGELNPGLPRDRRGDTYHYTNEDEILNF